MSARRWAIFALKFAVLGAWGLSLLFVLTHARSTSPASATALRALEWTTFALSAASLLCMTFCAWMGAFAWRRSSPPLSTSGDGQ